MRRKLAEQERLIADEMSRLTEELQHADNPSPVVKPVEPPVWRKEEDGLSHPGMDPAPRNKPHLARQRQRDMMLFFIAIIVLLVILIIVLWVAYVRNSAPINGT